MKKILLLFLILCTLPLSVFAQEKIIPVDIPIYYIREGSRESVLIIDPQNAKHIIGFDLRYIKKFANDWLYIPIHQDGYAGNNPELFTRLLETISEEKEVDILNFFIERSYNGHYISSIYARVEDKAL